MPNLRKQDDRPIKKKGEDLTTETTKHDRIEALCTLAKGALEKGDSWEHTLEFLEEQMIIRWALGATARRDYTKQVGLIMKHRAAHLMMQEKHK